MPDQPPLPTPAAAANPWTTLPPVLNGQGQTYVQRLEDKGYTPAAIQQWKARHMNQQVQAGWKPSQIDQFWGDQPKTATNLTGQVQSNLTAATTSPNGEPAGSAMAAAKPVSIGNDAQSLWSAGVAGLDDSVTSLLVKAPGKILPQHATMLQDTLYGLGQAAGDIPFYVSGAIMGAPAGVAAGPVGMAATGAAVSNALPTALRQALISDYQTPGGIKTWHEAATAMMTTMLQGSKAALEAAPTALVPAPVRAFVNKAEPVLGALGAKITGHAASLVTQAATMTGIAGALDDRVPDWKDFGASVISMLGVHVAGKVVGAMGRPVLNPAGKAAEQNAADIYASTGVHPKALAAAAVKDPLVKQEVIAPAAADGTRVTPHIDELAVPDTTAEKAFLPKVETTADEKTKVEQEANEKFVNNTLRTQGVDVKDEAVEEGEEGEKPEPPKEGEEPSDEYSLHQDLQAAKDFIGEIPKKPRLPIWTRLKNIIATFDSQLSPAHAADLQLERAGLLSKTASGFEDIMRAIYASASRASSFFYKGGFVWDQNEERYVPTGARTYFDALKAAQDAGGNEDEFNLVRIHASNLDRQPNLQEGRVTQLDPEASKRVLNHPEIQRKYGEALKIMKEVTDAPIRFAQSGDLLSKEQADAIIARNPNHVSFQRILGVTAAYQANRKTVRNPIKKMTGVAVDNTDEEANGDEDILGDKILQIKNPNLTMVANLKTLVALTDLNIARVRIFKKFFGMSAAWPEALGKIELVQPQTLGFDITKEVSHALGELTDEDGNPLLPEDALSLEPMLAFRRIQPFLRDGDVPFFLNGKMQIMRFSDPDLASIFKTAGAGEAHLLTTIAAGFAKVTREGIVLDPSFGLRAAFHAIMGSSVTGEHGAPPFVDLIRGVLGRLTGNPDLYANFQRQGGEATTLEDLNSKYTEKNLQALQETGYLRRAWNSVFNPITAAKRLSHMVANMGNFGYWLRTRGKLGDFKAAMSAREAHLDHAEPNRHAFMNWFAKTVTFFPVEVKSIQLLKRAMLERGPSTVLKGAMFLTVPAIGLRLWNYEEDKKLPVGQRYIDRPQWERDTYFQIPATNGTYHRLIIPYVIGFPFVVFPTRIMDKILEKNPHAFDGMFQAFMNNMVPQFIPNVLMPVAENVANKVFYSGEPLVPDKLAKLSPWYRYTDNTTDVAKKISQIMGPMGFNSSIDPAPVVIDNYLSEWGGPMTMKLLHTLDAAFDPRAHENLQDIPFVSAFNMTQPVGMQVSEIQDFYTDYDKVLQAQADVQRAKTDPAAPVIPPSIRRLAALDLSTEIADPNSHSHSGARKVTMSAALTNMANVIRAINNDKTMTNGEKADKIDSITGKMIQLANAGEAKIRAAMSGD
jgi:hypothetical protein